MTFHNVLSKTININWGVFKNGSLLKDAVFRFFLLHFSFLYLYEAFSRSNIFFLYIIFVSIDKSKLMQPFPLYVFLLQVFILLFLLCLFLLNNMYTKYVYGNRCIEKWKVKKLKTFFA